MPSTFLTHSHPASVWQFTNLVMFKELTGIDLPLVTKGMLKALSFNLEGNRLYYLFTILLFLPLLLREK